MSIQIEDLLNSKKLPTFLANNKTLRSFGKVHKVFPNIGLPNCKEDCVLDNGPFVKSSGIAFLNAINNVLYEISPRLTSFKAYYPNKKLTEEKFEKILYWGNVVYNLWAAISGRNCVLEINGKISLRVPVDVCDLKNEVVFKAGESLFKAYNKLYTAIADLKCGVKLEKLDTMPEFKRFSTSNLPSNKFQIVFSSDGVDGLWDIATMSMRGVSSCQSWTGQYRKNLVGSIVDPFVGIIYLTSGQDIDSLGTKMVKRSIVRWVVDSHTRKAFIIVDRMYPEYDENVMTLFLSFIKKRVGHNIDVKYSFNDYDIIDNSYIPYSKSYDNVNSSNLSYRDSKIAFSWDFNPKQTIAQKNIATKQTNFRNHLFNVAFSAAPKAKSDNKRIATIIDSSSFKYLFRDYYRSVADKIIELAPPDTDFSNSNEYMRKLCFFYLNNKHLTRSVKKSFIKHLNEYYKEKTNSKLLFEALDSVQIAIDSKIKSEIKKSFNKKIATVKLPG